MFSEEKYKEAANVLGCEVEVIKAVAAIESNSRGFSNLGHLICLFEGHKFSQFTNRRFDRQYPTLSYRRQTSRFYKNNSKRYASAFELDPEATMKSTSWGAFQIMGYHYKMLGFNKVKDLLDFLEKSIDNHLLVFIQFINNDLLLKKALIEKDWAKFAEGYNGKNYHINRYDVKMETAYNKFKNAKPS